jgi:predicted nucleic acid-binding Zn ribbon protein
VTGPAVAAETEPVSEREGVVTVACRSAVWAHELDLLGADIVERLNARLGSSGGSARVAGLRFVTRA